MAVNVARMKQQLVLHEGLRTTPYVDTLGFWTIGVGYNISARKYEFLEKVTGRKIAPKDGLTEKVKITEEEAMAVLEADIKRIEPIVAQHFPTYLVLNEVRQRVVLDMAFNLGFKAKQFVGTAEAIKKADWSGAAKHMYRSRWAYQVDDGEGGRFGRADRLAKMMLTGRDYER